MPLDWNDIDAFKRLGAFAQKKALEIGVDVTWGATFKSLKDYPHWEAKPWRTWAAKSKLYTGK